MALRIFLSYSTTNEAVAGKICQRLLEGQHKVYFAGETLLLGTKIPPELENRIKECDVFLVLWSAAEKGSDWVSQEIGIAVGSKRVILPIVLTRGLVPSGFIADRKYLPAFEGVEVALAYLEKSLRTYALEKQSREVALQQKKNNEAAV